MSPLKLFPNSIIILPFQNLSNASSRRHKHRICSISFPILAKNLSFVCNLVSSKARTTSASIVKSPFLVALKDHPSLHKAALISKIPKGLSFRYLLAALITVLFIRVIRVPYSRKFRLIFLNPTKLSSILSEIGIKEREKEYGNSILHPSNPKSVKVMNIVREIAQAMHNGLELKNDSSVRAFAPNQKNSSPILGPSLLVGKSRDVGKLRDNTIMKFGTRCSTKHLEGREWRVIVVDSNTDKGDNAETYIDGTILIHYNDSCLYEDLAFTIGHEFGHAIARHVDHCWPLEDGLLTWLLVKVCPDIHWSLFLRMMLTIRLFIQRRDELEADHIGIMLMASAGYNPQEAPASYRKYEYQSGSGNGSHPINGKRVESLENPEKFKIAMAVYREVLKARNRKA